MRRGFGVALVQGFEQGLDRASRGLLERAEVVCQRLAPLRDLALHGLIALAILLQAFAPLDCPAHGLQQLGSREWLEQVVQHAKANPGDGGVEALQAGHHDERHVVGLLTDLLREPEPVVPRQREIQQGHIHRMRPDAVERRVRVGGFDTPIPCGLQPCHQDVPHRGFVVNYQYLCAHRRHVATRGVRPPGSKWPDIPKLFQCSRSCWLQNRRPGAEA